MITLEELQDGEDVANCPSCTLRIRVIYDEQALEFYHLKAFEFKAVVGERSTEVETDKSHQERY